MENNDNKRIDLSGSGCFEKESTSIISTVLASNVLEKHFKLINEGSNSDLLMCLKSCSPRTQTISSPAVYINCNAKTEAELLINSYGSEVCNELPSDHAASVDDKELFY